MNDIAQVLRDQQQQMTQVLGAIEQSLADAVAAGERRGAATEAIENTLAELLVELERTGIASQIERVAEMIVRARPVVQVNVAAPVVHVVQPVEASWEVRIPGQRGEPDRVMTITRKPTA